MRRRVLITLTTSPVSLAAALGLPPGTPCFVTEIFCQMQPVASGGLGYVMDCTGQPLNSNSPPTPNVAPATALAVQLAAASSTAPGGTYGDQMNHPFTGQRADLVQFYVAGAHNGDPMLVQFWQSLG